MRRFVHFTRVLCRWSFDASYTVPRADTSSAAAAKLALVLSTTQIAHSHSSAARIVTATTTSQLEVAQSRTADLALEKGKLDAEAARLDTWLSAFGKSIDDADAIHENTVSVASVTAKEAERAESAVEAAVRQAAMLDSLSKENALTSAVTKDEIAVERRAQDMRYVYAIGRTMDAETLYSVAADDASAAQAALTSAVRAAADVKNERAQAECAARAMMSQHSATTLVLRDANDAETNLDKLQAMVTTAGVRTVNLHKNLTVAKSRHRLIRFDTEKSHRDANHRKTLASCVRGIIAAQLAAIESSSSIVESSMSAIHDAHFGLLRLKAALEDVAQLAPQAAFADDGNQINVSDLDGITPAMSAASVAVERLVAGDGESLTARAECLSVLNYNGRALDDIGVLVQRESVTMKYRVHEANCNRDAATIHEHLIHRQVWELETRRMNSITALALCESSIGVAHTQSETVKSDLGQLSSKAAATISEVCRLS